MEKILTRSLFSFIVIVIAVPFFVTDVKACSCQWPLASPYEAYEEATAVFIGKVTDSKDVPYEESVREKKFTVFDRHFSFMVEESFKGAKATKINLSVGRVDSSCYSGFSLGESYLVYAHRGSDGVLTSGFCSRTTNVKDARDDIYYIGALMEGRSEPRLYGSVTRSDDDPTSPGSRRVTYLEGIKVIAESNQRRYECMTNAKGLYSFNNLPAGKYSVRPLLPEKYMSYFFSKEDVTVEAKGFGTYAEFLTGWNNRISGRVLDAEGRAVERAVIRLLPVERPSEKMTPTHEGISDYLGKEGKYEIYGETPGRYLLAVEIYAPFKSGMKVARSYYPQASSPEKAVVIALDESDKLNLDVKLLPGLFVRQIEGIVLWPDGAPVIENGYVFLERLEESKDQTNVRYDLARVEEGRFTIQAFEGAEYWLHADVGTLGLNFGRSKNDLWDSGIQQLRAQPIRLKVGRDNPPVKIVIPLPEGSSVPKR